MSTETRPAQRASQAAVGDLQMVDRLSAMLSTAFHALTTTYADWLGVVILVAGLAGYLFNLGGWLITDDEGSYFYQSWRVSLGEVPYRDFLTPQLPLFLGVGGLIQRVLGPDPLPLRVVSIVLVLGAGWALYRVLRRYMASSMALVGLAAFLAHPDVYAVGRVYRSEPYMLFFICLGFWAFVIGEERRQQRWLILAGVCFGLAVLTKLFAALALAGLGLYVVVRSQKSEVRRMKDEGRIEKSESSIINHQSPITNHQSLVSSLQSLISPLLALGLPAVLVAGSVMGIFLLLVPETFTAIFGHQLMQGSQLSRWDVFLKGLAFYQVYFTEYAPLLVFALPMAIRVWREGGRRTLLAWQLTTLFAFIFLSRELWARHLVYLVPALVGLMAASLEPMLAWGRRGFLLSAVIGALILPWVFKNNIVAHYSEQGTWRIADFMAAEVGPDGSFLADYPELNYYARRPTGYAAASLSQGAASSGQTTGSRLAAELDSMGGTAIVVELSDFSQLRFLRDRQQFLAYLDQNFRPLGILKRSYQTFQIYRRKTASPQGPELNFGGQLTLFTGNVLTEQVASGGVTEVGLRFGVRAPALADRQRPPLGEDYVAFIHVQDADGFVWGQGDGALTNSLKKLTSDWSAGELNADRIDLFIRPGAPPGVYDVIVGVYRQRDLARLNILNADGNPVGTEYKLTELIITAPPRQPTPSDLKLGASAQGDLGPARLVGYTLDPPVVEAGDSVRMELGWQVSRNFAGQLALSLVGPGGEVGRQTFPVAATAGETTLRQLSFPVDADTPGGEYTLQAQLLDAQGAPLGATQFGALTVKPVAATFEKPRIGRPLRVDLGGRVDLAGYDLVSETVRPGGTVDLTLYWHPQGRLTRSLKVFTHLVAGDGRIVGQRDNAPVDNTRPTTGWRPGEYIADRYVIAVPGDTPAGRYELRAGLYDPLKNERLPVTVDGKPAPDGQVFLGIVEVKP